MIQVRTFLLGGACNPQHRDYRLSLSPGVTLSPLFMTVTGREDLSTPLVSQSFRFLTSKDYALYPQEAPTPRRVRVKSLISRSFQNWSSPLPSTITVYPETYKTVGTKCLHLQENVQRNTSIHKMKASLMIFHRLIYPFLNSLKMYSKCF